MKKHTVPLPTATFYGRCRTCHQNRAIVCQTISSVSGRPFFGLTVRCNGVDPLSPDPRRCAAMVSVRRVEGKINRKIKCGEHCERAVDFKCSCECGGENHGVDVRI